MNPREIVITELNCYPIKSCRGIALSTASIGNMGIKYDRQWMVVNEQGTFVAQRGDSSIGTVGIKSMCLIEPLISTSHLIINAPGMQTLSLPLVGKSGTSQTVRVWDSFSTGLDQGDEAAAWFTEYLSKELPGNYRLVRMPDEGTRNVGTTNNKVAFADAFPFLLTSEETLAALNELMEESVPMNRFRPNIVIRGAETLFEDKTISFSVGDITFTAGKRCGRCPITTIDQLTAQITSKDPLKTLATFNKEGNNVYFGIYLTSDRTGTINVGDTLTFN